MSSAGSSNFDQYKINPSTSPRDCITGGFNQPSNGISFLPTETIENADVYNVEKELDLFWFKARKRMRELNPANGHQELPLARVKKIMRLDEDVKCQMISAEAPLLLSKAAELFIEELTLRSWLNTEESKRKTLQKSDISLAVSKHIEYDFLVDIVPFDLRRRRQDGDVMLPDVVDCRAFSSTESNGTVQYVLQVGSPDDPISSGTLVQATPIGQPIQLPISTNMGQQFQVITLSLPEGDLQQLQL